MRALILAAGAGSRLRPLTRAVPKPLVSVGGAPMAVRQIVALREAGVRDVVINAAHCWRLLRAALGDGSAWGVRIHWSVEGDSVEEALETRGGIVKALPLLSPDGESPFLVVAGDIVTDYPYERLVERGAGLGTDALAHLVLVPNPSYHPSGDMRLEDGRVRRDAPTHTFSSLGVYHPALFAGVEPVEAGLFPWMNAFCAEGCVTGEIYEGYWRNVGDFRELALANEEAPRLSGVWPRPIAAHPVEA